MKYAQTAALISGTLFLLLLLSFALAIEDNSRTAEINTQCSSYLSSASDLVPDDDGSRSVRLKNELSFSGGDWEQHPGSISPLMPFDGSDSGAWFPTGPEKLVGFDVIDVNPIIHDHVPNAVSLSGYLTIGIYRNRSLDHDIGFEPGFSKKPGFSTLVIMFEGVYVEHGGEKVLCLLGNSRMPLTDRVDEPSYLANNYLSIYGSQSELDSDGTDDRVLLVLRYPRSFNLTSRAIKGEMTSCFGEQGSSRYFDPVQITSQLRNYSDYSFSETVASRVCNDSLFRDEMIENGAIGFNTSTACMILQELQSIRFSVELNVDPETSRLGPFVLDKEKKDSKQHREDFILIFQSIRCEVENGSVDDSARVSAVVRAISVKTDQVTASFRTGISGATMSIEGSWNNELFCGVGCFEDRCDTQISFYFPRWLSVKQRNIVSGTISSSIGNQSDDAYYSPLKFTFLAQPSSLMNYTMMPCRYNYSMIDSARELWERKNKEFDFTTTIEKSILRYPSMEQLSFRSYVIAVRPHYAGRFMVQMEVLSLGPFCGDYGDTSGNGDHVSDSRLVNLSIHLKFIDEPHWHFNANYEVVTDMFFEGVYDNSLGEMHLIGCTGSDTEMDCLIEASLKYSPSNTQWSKHPTVNINVTSQRNITDPLRFTPVTLLSYVIGSDERVEKDLLFRVIFEGTLRILVISLDIGIVLSQFAYMNKNIDSVPRISLVMIGIQILGYVVPFIGGPEFAVPSKMSKSFQNYPRPRFWFDIIEHGTRFLLLVLISVMLMFFKRVKESRRTTESEHVTNDKKILVITTVFHTIGFAIFAAPRIRMQSEDFGRSPPSWAILLKKYFDVIQTLFPVPQIITTYLSKSKNDHTTTPAAITKIYTFWFVFSRLLLDFYDKYRDHVPHPTSWEMNSVMEMVNRHLMGVRYEGEALLMAVLVVTAAIVYICRGLRGLCYDPFWTGGHIVAQQSNI